MAENNVLAGKSFVAPREKEMSFCVLADPQRIPMNGTHYLAVRDALFKVFGNFPLRLDKHHAVILVAMAAVAGEGAKPYEILCEALRKYGAIEVRD